MKPRARIMKAAIVSLVALAGTGLAAHAGPYTFTNFDAPSAPTGVAGAGTFANGISNNGAVDGFSISANGAFNNFIRHPNGSFTPILQNDPLAMTFGINSSNTVVGVNGNTQAIQLNSNGTPTTLLQSNPNIVSSMAFGINDKGTIVGQYTNNMDQSPGFILNGSNLITINTPLPQNVVFAQGINNNGLVVGFYVGLDGQDHGFVANVNGAVNDTLGITPITDPKIPNVPGETGATFVFSQILGINDQGIAVGYYGDSTTSQHGFLYNTNTGQYTFLDDPNEGFNNGVEVTQITGINNAGDIAGFYTDANGTFHSFIAVPTATATPEPASMTLFGIGIAGLAGYGWRRRKRAM